MSNTAHFPPALLQKAANIKVAFFDVDGVLTDGGLAISAEGEATKRFNTLDGYGIKLLQRAGITPAVISGRDSPALRNRLAALGIAHSHLGSEDKLPAAQSILGQLQCEWRNAAAMGDDWPDLPVLQRCAFSCAPANAHTEVLGRVDYVTQRLGGSGAAREFCDALLHAGGHYARLLGQVVGA